MSLRGNILSGFNAASRNAAPVGLSYDHILSKTSDSGGGTSTQTFQNITSTGGKLLILVGYGGTSTRSVNASDWDGQSLSPIVQRVRSNAGANGAAIFLFDGGGTSDFVLRLSGSSAWATCTFVDLFGFSGAQQVTDDANGSTSSLTLSYAAGLVDGGLCAMAASHRNENTSLSWGPAEMVELDDRDDGLYSRAGAAVGFPAQGITSSNAYATNSDGFTACGAFLR